MILRLELFGFVLHIGLELLTRGAGQVLSTGRGRGIKQRLFHTSSRLHRCCRQLRPEPLTGRIVAFRAVLSKLLF